MRNVVCRQLEEKILELIQNNIDEIVNGGAVDHADYTARCAYIKGLRDAIRLSEDIERDYLGINKQG